MKVRIVALSLAALSFATAPASGQASLDKCQKEAANQSAKFVGGVTKAVATCLQKISGVVVKKNDAIAGAAKSCAGAFRKLENSEAPGKALFAKAEAKIRLKCDPAANASLGHSAAQVLNLSLMPRGLEAKGLDSWCVHFGGDGSIDTVAEWIDCQLQAGLCQARQQLALEYPRVLEWANGVETEIAALGAQPKLTDALVAVQDLIAAVDRFANNQITINCGPGINTCGNGVKDGIDDCDGADLGAASCGSVGFRSGTLSCQPDCHFDVSGCVTGAFPATGQTISYQAGDDGDVELGAAAALVDNGDGTITDNRTGLMWEKKDRSGGLHDRGNTYHWDHATNPDTTDFINALNGMPCFAGYCDW
ncbi:MAG TPA: hypothetical protein VEB21_16270, partial [Terriglobales bacterium]|nr:hypothetical protein [Terriglobales bacterium]